MVDAAPEESSRSFERFTVECSWNRRCLTTPTPTDHGGVIDFSVAFTSSTHREPKTSTFHSRPIPVRKRTSHRKRGTRGHRNSRPSPRADLLRAFTLPVPVPVPVPGQVW